MHRSRAGSCSRRLAIVCGRVASRHPLHLREQHHVLAEVDVASKRRHAVSRSQPGPWLAAGLPRRARAPGGLPACRVATASRRHCGSPDRAREIFSSRIYGDGRRQELSRVSPKGNRTVIAAATIRDRCPSSIKPAARRASPQPIEAFNHSRSRARTRRVDPQASRIPWGLSRSTQAGPRDQLLSTRHRVLRCKAQHVHPATTHRLDIEGFVGNTRISRSI